MESLNNQTFTALKNNCFYNGKTDDVLAYSSFTLNITSSNLCKIIINQSNDNTNLITTTVNYTDVDNLTVYSANLSSRYIYFQILNDSGTDATSLAFTVLYKTNIISTGGGSGGDVSIISPLTGGAVNVSVSNLPSEQDVNITNASLAITGSVDVNNFPNSYPVTNADITNIYNVVNSRGSGTLWSGSATGAGGVSLAVNLTSKNVKNITFMGNCNGATLLTVQFSSDGTTYYDSQYAFTLSASGDVGFSLACCANYVRVKSSNNVTATLYINYC
jgi:hypothetical protein